MSQTPVEQLGIKGTDFVMFSTNWCGYCKRLKSQLNESGVEFREVNVEEEIEFAPFVELVNGGNRVVPTLLFSDGCITFITAFENYLLQIVATAILLR
jgi:mycoredoxin